jgi:hypothetical protein
MAQQLADLMNTKKVSGNTTEQYPESRRARSRVKHDLSSMSSTYKSKEEFSTKLEDKTTDKKQKLVGEKQKLNNSKTTDKQQKNHNHNSFTKNPLPIEFALLGGKGKDIIEYILLKSNNTGDEVPIRSSDIVENMRVSRDHVSDTIVRLYKKGYIRYTAHYGFRVLAVNPSILS